MSKESQKLSRRSFLKGAALAGVSTVGVAALAGCSNTTAASPAGSAKADWLPAAWDYETDVLVIGYGGAGMWSSLISADEGASKVLVLEKAPVEGGGNSRINNGEWAIIDKDKASTFKDYIRTFTQGKTPDNMIEAWVDECVRNTEYADKYGITYSVSEVRL